MLLGDVMSHVEEAKKFLAINAEDAMRHAALELRLAIECLIYQLLPLYKDEITDDILAGWNWQPARILEALVECNPGVERGQSFSAWFGGPRTGPPVVSGRQRGLERKMLKKYYQKLGSLVHANMRGRPINVQRAAAFLSTAAARIEDHCRETTMLINGIQPAVEIACRCGRTIRRSLSAARSTQIARCPSPACGAVYDLVVTSDDRVVANRQREDFGCPKCNHVNAVPVAALPHRFHCDGCGAEFIVDYGVFVSFAPTDAGPDAPAA